MTTKPRRRRWRVASGLFILYGVVLACVSAASDVDEFEVNTPGVVETVSDLRKDSGDLSVGAVLMDGFERYDARDFREGDKVVLSNGDEFTIKDGHWQATGRRLEVKAAEENVEPTQDSTATGRTATAAELPKEPNSSAEKPQDKQTSETATADADDGPSADLDDFLEGETVVEKDGTEYRKQGRAWVRTGRNLKDPAVGGPAFQYDEPVLGELDRLPSTKPDKKSPETQLTATLPEPVDTQPELFPAPRSAEPSKTTVIDRLALPVLPATREPLLGEKDPKPSPPPEKQSPKTDLEVETSEPEEPQPEPSPKPGAEKAFQVTSTDQQAQPDDPATGESVSDEQELLPDEPDEKKSSEVHQAASSSESEEPQPESSPEPSADGAPPKTALDRLALPVLPAMAPSSSSATSQVTTSAPPTSPSATVSSTSSSPAKRFYMPPPSDTNGKISLEVSCSVTKEGITWSVRGVAGHRVRGVLKGTDDYSATFEGIGTATHTRPLPQAGVVDTCVARDIDLGLMRSRRQHYGEGGQPLKRTTPSGSKAP